MIFCLYPISRVLISNLALFVEHFDPKCANGPKSFSSLILTKIRIHPILNVVISNLTLVFENFESKSPNLEFWVKKYQLSNLNEICLHPIKKALISNLTLVFVTFWAQMRKIWHRHFGPKGFFFIYFIYPRN